MSTREIVVEELPRSCKKLKELASDSEEFLNRAARKLSKRSKTLQQIDFLNVRKMWGSNRKVDQIYESLWPKLLKAEEDAKKIQVVLEAKKESAICLGNSLSDLVEGHISGHESRLNELDDLSNDCRQIIYDARKEIGGLLAAMEFNCEIVAQRLREHPSREHSSSSNSGHKRRGSGSDDTAKQTCHQTKAVSEGAYGSDVAANLVPTTTTSTLSRPLALTVGTSDSPPSDIGLINSPLPASCSVAATNNDDAVIAAATAALLGDCDETVAEPSSGVLALYDIDGPTMWPGHPRSPLLPAPRARKERSRSFGDTGLVAVMTNAAPVGAFASPQGSPTQIRKSLNSSTSPADSSLSPFSLSPSNSTSPSSTSSSNSSSPSPDKGSTALQPQEDTDKHSPHSPLYLNLSPVAVSPIPFPLSPPSSPSHGTKKKRLHRRHSGSDITSGITGKSSGSGTSLLGDEVSKSEQNVASAVALVSDPAPNSQEQGAVDSSLQTDAKARSKKHGARKADKKGSKTIPVSSRNVDDIIAETNKEHIVDIPTCCEAFTFPLHPIGAAVVADGKGSKTSSIIDASADAEQCGDAESRRKMLTAKCVDLRSIHFTLQSAQPTSAASSAATSCPTLEKKEPAVDASTQVIATPNLPKTTTRNMSSSSGASTPGSKRRQSFRSQGSGGSKRDWNSESSNSLRIDNAIESVLEEYPTYVVKVIRQDKEHQRICDQLRSIAQVATSPLLTVCRLRLHSCLLCGTVHFCRLN
jgi:hypothetical protein